MTNTEFSNQFDILLNSFNPTSTNITLDEYEKSLYLTKAQEEIVEELYSGKNINRESFEDTEELRRSLDSLIRTKTLKLPQPTPDDEKIRKDSVFYALPDNKDDKVWFITYESVILKDDRLGCKNGSSVVVTPITQDDFDRINKNPFRQANTRRVLRLDAGNNLVELISKYNIDSYLIRYLKRPSPIILIDLPEDLSINGETIKTECSLNPMIHNMILDRAVRLALQSKSIGASR